ncbi:MAG: restriction endonuclease [Polyangiaceae bacterium UTPRO1]|jgi:putative restriction endonuclease|nr:HNH endonuclease [Myxococcales bacterium]OQY66245.1 MAG: restriction endonuclease [Polyangiaceae bacterium UTPRO1]
MKLYVGITDRDWFEFLSRRPGIDEVNFWQPSGSRAFRVLQPGEPFLFKLHSPVNFIVGGGFLARYSPLPVELAWDAFGEKNGAGSLDEMRLRIAKYRRVRADPRESFTIGCIILVEPFFFPRDKWIPIPSEFPKHVQQGKSYDAATGTGRAIWSAVEDVLHHDRQFAVAESDALMWGTPGLVRRRLGQGSFRVLVTDTYERRCAITREKALPVLQAAHIRPVTKAGQHRVDNGILLRSDVHTLFDQGYLTVTPEHRVRVSGRLKKDFDNGEHYYQLDGSELWVPQRSEDRPNREFLAWHADTVFRG